MTKSREELSSNQPQILSNLSKDNLQVGDILLFKAPDQAKMNDRFIQFAQKRKGMSDEDAACVHVAIVTKVTPSKSTVISHYLNNGCIQEPLKHADCAYNQHEYDVLRVKNDPDNTKKNTIAMEARNIAEMPSGQTNYSTLKAIASFLRKEGDDQEKTRSKVPGYFAEEKNREICSSFVARIVKRVQGDDSNIASSFMLPGQLRNSLTNNPSFEVNPVKQQVQVMQPITENRQPEAAVAAGSKKNRMHAADPDTDVKKENEAEKREHARTRVRKHKTDTSDTTNTESKLKTAREEQAQAKNEKTPESPRPRMK